MRKPQLKEPWAPDFSPSVGIVDGDGDFVDFRKMINLLQDIKQELIKLNAK